MPGNIQDKCGKRNYIIRRSVGVAAQHLEEVQRNAAKIVRAAIAIEHRLELLIVHRVFGGETGSRLHFFTDHILGSDWFTFSAKRRLAVQIVDEKGLLAGPQKNRFDKVLSEVMSLRNAFAHGSVVEKGDGTYLAFFQSAPREVHLTDEYWAGVEATFGEAFELCLAVETKLGLVRESQPPS